MAHGWRVALPLKMLNPLKIVALLTGDKYPKEYIVKLYRGLLENTKYPFELEVVTKTKYPGWWGKLEQFGRDERILLLDVDLIITGNIDFLFEYEGPFCAWHDPRDDGMNGSVNSIGPGFGTAVREIFDKAPDKYMHSYYSDQEFLRDHTQPDYWDKGLIQSYKFDHLDAGPGDARIVVFHGHPKPHEIWDGWVKEYWQ